jgi:hypothetical protein
MENEDLTPIVKPNGKKRDITTVAISRNSMQKLELICESLGIDKKDFLEKSIDYFTKTGDDPRDPIKDNLIGRLSKIENRIIGFIKTQDTDYLKVLLEDTKSAQKRLSTQKEELQEFIRVNSKTIEGNILNLAKAVVSEQRKISNPIESQLVEIQNEKSEVKRIRGKVQEVVNFIEANVKTGVIGGGLTLQQVEIIGTHLKALV